MRIFKDFIEWLWDGSESTLEFILRIFPIIIVLAIIITAILYLL